MTNKNNYSGIAALTLVESLLLSLNDRNILPEAEIMSILEDAAITHEDAARMGESRQMHDGVAALIRKIISGGNSVRRR